MSSIFSATTRLAHGLALAIVVSALLAPGVTAARQSLEWGSLVHPQRGFTIAYPSNVFQVRDGAAEEDGRVFVSRDGRAKLLVGAFDNSAEFTIASYRKYLLDNNYTGAVLDYERNNPRWFIISGTRGDTMFYERVTFTCGGRLINSWAMLYPVAERNFYDRIVEAVARSYSPGAGVTGDCS